VPFTLGNLKEDLEDLGSRFDGAPDLEFEQVRGDSPARRHSVPSAAVWPVALRR
jgi:hypothetical protein